RAREVYRRALQPGLPRVALVDAEKHARDLRPAPADQPGQTDDLAVSDVEADVAEDAGPGQTPDLEEDLADRRLDLGKERDAPPAPVPHKVGGGEAGCRGRDDVLAIAEHGGPVTQVEDFVEPVTDE